MTMPPDSFLGVPASRVLAVLGFGMEEGPDPDGLPEEGPWRHHAPIENHLFVGPGVSGTQMHVHAAAVNLLLGGRKLWITKGTAGTRAEGRPSVQLLAEILSGNTGSGRLAGEDGQYQFCI